MTVADDERQDGENVIRDGRPPRLPLSPLHALDISHATSIDRSHTDSNEAIDDEVSLAITNVSIQSDNGQNVALILPRGQRIQLSLEVSETGEIVRMGATPTPQTTPAHEDEEAGDKDEDERRVGVEEEDNEGGTELTKEKENEEEEFAYLPIRAPSPPNANQSTADGSNLGSGNNVADKGNSSGASNNNDDLVTAVPVIENDRDTALGSSSLKQTPPCGPSLLTPAGPGTEDPFNTPTSQPVIPCPPPTQESFCPDVIVTTLAPRFRPPPGLLQNGNEQIFAGRGATFHLTVPNMDGGGGVDPFMTPPPQIRRFLPLLPSLSTPVDSPPNVIRNSQPCWMDAFVVDGAATWDEEEEKEAKANDGKHLLRGVATPPNSDTDGSPDDVQDFDKRLQDVANRLSEDEGKSDVHHPPLDHRRLLQHASLRLQEDKSQGSCSHPQDDNTQQILRRYVSGSFSSSTSSKKGAVPQSRKPTQVNGENDNRNAVLDAVAGGENINRKVAKMDRPDFQSEHQHRRMGSNGLSVSFNSGAERMSSTTRRTAGMSSKNVVAATSNGGGNGATPAQPTTVTRTSFGTIKIYPATTSTTKTSTKAHTSSTNFDTAGATSPSNNVAAAAAADYRQQLLEEHHNNLSGQYVEFISNNGNRNMDAESTASSVTLSMALQYHDGVGADSTQCRCCAHHQNRHRRLSDHSAAGYESMGMNTANLNATINNNYTGVDVIGQIIDLITPGCCSTSGDNTKKKVAATIRKWGAYQPWHSVLSMHQHYGRPVHHHQRHRTIKNTVVPSSVETVAGAVPSKRMAGNSEYLLRSSSGSVFSTKGMRGSYL